MDGKGALQASSGGKALGPVLSQVSEGDTGQKAATSDLTRDVRSGTQAQLKCKFPRLKQSRSVQRTSDEPKPLVHPEVGSKRKSLFVPEPVLPAVSSKQVFTSTDSCAIKPVAKLDDGLTNDPFSASHDRANAAAKALLKHADFSAQSLIHMISLFSNPPLSLNFGICYNKAGMPELTTETQANPDMCKYLSAFVHHVVPHHVFHNMRLLDDQLDPHCRASLAIPLTQFKGGEICCVSHQHRVSFDVRMGPTFLPECDHQESSPWTGRRLLLCTDFVEVTAALPGHLQAKASELGFVFKVFKEASLSTICRLDPRTLKPLSCARDSSPSVHARMSDLRKDLTPEDLLFVELCAGTGILSKTASKAGFRTLAVDNNRVRAPSKSTVMLDLANPFQVDQLLELLDSERDRLAVVFIAPPCGTASRARERKLCKWARKGFRIPQPLRTDEFPDMKPGLLGRDRSKTELANQLYDQITRIALSIIDKDVLVTIENPTNSLYWKTSFFQRLRCAHAGFDVDFHSCCHGGERPKLTRFWASRNVFQHLAALCDGTHSHKPWTPRVRGRRLHFVTADEAAYPLLLCQRIVSTILDLNFPDACPSSVLQPKLSDKHTRSVLGSQPRGRHKPLVSEFSSYHTCFSPGDRSKQLDNHVSQLPKGARIVRRKLVSMGDVLQFLLNASIPESDSNVFLLGIPDPRNREARFSQQSSESVEMSFVGIPCDPQEFLRRAFSAGHPRGLEIHLEECIQQAAFANFRDDPFTLAKTRVDFVKKWSLRARQLQADEDALHAGMPDYLSHVLKGKRLLLLREMMESAGCPDKGLVDDISKGFRISGWMPATGNTDPKVRRPSMSLETLKVLSKGINSASLKKLTRRQDAELETVTWTETESEIAAGWVWKAAADNSCVFIATRFGIRQGPKIRLIDDCTCCGLNGTTGLRERFDLHTIDKFAVMVAFAFEHGSNAGLASLSGRTFDLKSAYKQFGVHPLDRQHLRIAVNRPGAGTPELLGVNSLPFGAVGSVSAFLRVSYALWRIGVVLLKAFWTSYFDDFSVVARSELTHNTQWAIECLFDLLGIKFDRDGKKALPFSQTFNMLGLSVDLEASSDRVMRVGHTNSRRQELVEYIDSIISCGSIEPRVFERLRGRMVFFEGYSFGRVANQSVRTLAKACRDSVIPVPLDQELTRALLEMKSRVGEASPLQVTSRVKETWYLFSDGASTPEERWGGIGAVLFSPNGSCVGWFGEQVPEGLMDSLLDKSSNPIYELEIAPILVAVSLWRQFLQGSQLVCYLDNEAARFSYIRCFAESLPADAWIQSFLKLEADLQLNLWFGRVPTSSNIADGPSKLLGPSFVDAAL